ncbi:MAG: flagellar basal body rod protein FlgC [Planctomycetota bacterium]
MTSISPNQEPRSSLSRVFRSMRIAGSSLNAERARIDTITKNIANARTTRVPETGLPYEREELSFAPIMERESRTGEMEFYGVRVNEVLKDDAPFEEVYDPTHPDADERGVVLYPNVNTMKEMADLVTAVRSYEANLSVQQTFEQMAQRALRLAE